MTDTDTDTGLRSGVLTIPVALAREPYDVLTLLDKLQAHACCVGHDVPRGAVTLHIERATAEGGDPGAVVDMPAAVGFRDGDPQGTAPEQPAAPVVQSHPPTSDEIDQAELALHGAAAARRTALYMAVRAHAAPVVSIQRHRRLMARRTFALGGIGFGGGLMLLGATLLGWPLGLTIVVLVMLLVGGTAVTVGSHCATRDHLAYLLELPEQVAQADKRHRAALTEHLQAVRAVYALGQPISAADERVMISPWLAACTAT